jgi:hypothetical protein
VEASDILNGALLLLIMIYKEHMIICGQDIGKKFVCIVCNEVHDFLGVKKSHNRSTGACPLAALAGT